MEFIGLLTDKQKRAGYFVGQDEDFIWLYHKHKGRPRLVATFLYQTATIREIRDKAEEDRHDHR